MAKQKSLEQLRAEKEQVEKRLGEQKEISGERRKAETYPPPLQSGRHD